MSALPDGTEVYLDAEKAVINYLVPVLAAYDPTVKIDVRGSGPGPFVRVRRIGGTDASPRHDAPSLDVMVWHDSDRERMALAQHLWAWLRALNNTPVLPLGGPGAVLTYTSTFLGPRQLPDPADETAALAMFTVQLLCRAA